MVMYHMFKSLSAAGAKLLAKVHSIVKLAHTHPTMPSILLVAAIATCQGQGRNAEGLVKNVKGNGRVSMVV